MKKVVLMLLLSCFLVNFSAAQSAVKVDTLYGKNYVSLDDFIIGTVFLFILPDPTPNKLLVIGIDEELWQNPFFFHLITEETAKRVKELEVTIWAPRNSQWKIFDAYEKAGIKIVKYYCDEKILQCHLLIIHDKNPADIFSDKTKFVKRIGTIYRRAHVKTY